MKNITIHKFKCVLLVIAGTLSLSACSLVGLDAQDSYDYEKKILDPHINMTAREFLESRANGNAANPTDTVFRWMKKGLDYAGLDLNEYEKPGRTFLFLHNDAIMVRNATNQITGGFFFSFPIIRRNPDGSIMLDPNTNLPLTDPAKSWSDYKKETVRKYFLYLIGEGEFNFEDLGSENVTIKSLLPANSQPDTDEKSTLKLVNGGKGFDQEGLFTLKIQNNSDLGPLMFNDATVARSAGYIATNGIVHVFGAVLNPYRLITTP